MDSLMTQPIKVRGTAVTGRSFITILKNASAFEEGGLQGNDGTTYSLGDKNGPVFLIVEGTNGRLLIGGDTEVAGFKILGIPRGTNQADLPDIVAFALSEAARLSTK